MSVDPIAEDYPQLSSYNYAGNKPVSSRDIEGLQSELDPSLEGGGSDSNMSAGDHLIAGAKYLGLNNVGYQTAHQAGVLTGAFAGFLDTAEFGHRGTLMGMVQDILKGNKTIHQEMYESISVLTEQLSTQEGRETLMSAIETMIDDTISTALGEKGMFEAGVVHGRALFDVLLGVATGGGGTAVKLASAFKSGPKALAKFLGSKADDFAKGATKSLDSSNLPYSKHRPSYKQGQVEKVWESAKQVDGNVYDPNTGEIMRWDKTQGRNGQWDMGHIRGQKYKDVHSDYMQGRMSKRDFLDWYQNPDNYKPELPKNNRSRAYD